MPLPLLLVIPALIAAGGGGALAGLDGADRMLEARRRCDDAERRQQAAHERLKAKEARTDKQLRAYGAFQEGVREEVLLRFVAWLEANRRSVNLIDAELLDGLDLPEHVLLRNQDFGADAGSLLAGGITSIVAGVAARQAALTGVRMVATASTGAAISGLSGAAAESATLAWIGGGTLAAGGTGVAGGAMVLTGIGIAPTVLLGGLALNKEGRKAQTQAARFEAEVEEGVATWALRGRILERVRRRVRELRAVLQGLSDAARRSLDELELLSFDHTDDDHLRRFQEAALLVRSVREVLAAPILDAKGGVSSESERVAFKYKKYATAA